jgi:hypothetical protein
VANFVVDRNEVELYNTFQPEFDSYFEFRTLVNSEFQLMHQVTLPLSQDTFVYLMEINL